MSYQVTQEQLDAATAVQSDRTFEYVYGTASAEFQATYDKEQHRYRLLTSENARELKGPFIRFCLAQIRYLDVEEVATVRIGLQLGQIFRWAKRIKKVGVGLNSHYVADQPD